MVQLHICTTAWSSEPNLYSINCCDGWRRINRKCHALRTWFQGRLRCLGSPRKPRLGLERSASVLPKGLAVSSLATCLTSSNKKFARRPQPLLLLLRSTSRNITSPGPRKLTGMDQFRSASLLGNGLIKVSSPGLSCAIIGVTYDLHSCRPAVSCLD